LSILVPKEGGYEIPNGFIGAKRDINIKLMSKLKNEDIRGIVGISKEYNIWKDHFLFEKNEKCWSKVYKTFKNKWF
jgi:hypothetical protein